MTGKNIIRSIMPSALALVAGSALAHDEWGLTNPEISSRSSVTPAVLAQLASKTNDEGARYVYERALLWNPGSLIRACFYGGSASARDSVAKIVKDFFQTAGFNLKIDFNNNMECLASGQSRSFEFRFGLDSRYGCCAAYVGRQSITPAVIASGPNIMIAGSPSNHTIIHEVMHALGVHHEHQSPAANCENEFDLAAMSSAYGWPIDKVRANVKQLDNNSFSYTWSSSYDPSSIMKYYFSPRWLKSGQSSPCFSKQASRPSVKDYEGLRRAYPGSFSSATHREKLSKSRDLAAQNVPSDVLELINTMD